MTGLCLRTSRLSLPCGARHFSSLRSIYSSKPNVTSHRGSSFHSGGLLFAKRNKAFFQSNAKPPLVRPEVVVPQQDPNLDNVSHTTEPKRKFVRSPAAKKSLRRVAVEAERSREGKKVDRETVGGNQAVSKTVTAICAAEEYDISKVAKLLEGNGYAIDPYETDLFPQVVHAIVPIQNPTLNQENPSWSSGDLLVFPSGTIVAWAIPENVLSALVSRTLHPAAQYPLEKIEEEDLEYVEDPKKSTSIIKADRIIIGTKPRSPGGLGDTDTSSAAEDDQSLSQSVSLDTALAKIAFSSGLARSTKLAVLESLLNDYFQSTRSIPAVLSRGGRIPFTRKFILQKTGQLLGIRAQLNLYSELTDSLPDIFWDSRHDLGLEGYYDDVGRALDIGIRIKVLNQKMDYAQEIASVLRSQLSEKHGVRLEWIIIILIAVEVVFAIEREFYDYRDKRDITKD